MSNLAPPMPGSGGPPLMPESYTIGTSASVKTSFIYTQETVYNDETVYTTKPIYTSEVPHEAPSSSTPQTNSNHSPPIGVIVGTTIGGIILLLVGAFLLLWYQRRQNPKTHPYSGALPDPLPELENHQIGGFYPQGGTINSQGHELPAQEMSHAQELSIGYSNAHELPVEKKW